MARYSHLSERTYRRHFAQPYEFIRLNQALIEAAIVPTHFQVLDFYFNASLTALNMAKWEQYQQRNIWEPFVFSMASYKCRKLNQHLLERFIHNLDLDGTLIKRHPNYQSLCDYGLLVS